MTQPLDVLVLVVVPDDKSARCVLDKRDGTARD